MTEQERGPSTMTRNEAAERLRAWPSPQGSTREFYRLVNEALATERRLTVEKVRVYCMERGWAIHMPDNEYAVLDPWQAILDDLATAAVDEEEGKK